MPSKSKSAAATGPVSQFARHHFRHFNAAALIDATDDYIAHLDGGGKMLVTLAGAMSTAELGLSLAEMIRQDKVHAITCTGANLEEDLYNLVAHEHYERVPHYRNLSDAEEQALLERHLNRVTDTCIPEEEAIRRLERQVVERWQQADRAGERRFPHEYLCELLRSGALAEHYQIDPRDSWLVAACERQIPLYVPGWEDSTLGNIFVAHVLSGDLSGYGVVRSGAEYMGHLVDWYRQATRDGSVGFFQIGGGIAGDFPICVVPLIHQDLQQESPYWGYFCQISDSTTSFGSYSGAVPNEKISWGKLAVDTPRFVIESDATIVAPLIFAYLLGW
ncbi:MAG TPA: deoxyhypusine synthase family protein [Thermoanaerobaculia bacterium]|nr:deoxyhypusine synthase family protein [Thermoanaerobaculia bacterium]